nr:probable leucine-rich repeat receptor-like protein kinase At1g35710 [Aegilops tauschii subsp. strangulata]
MRAQFSLASAIQLIRSCLAMERRAQQGQASGRAAAWWGALLLFLLMSSSQLRGASSAPGEAEALVEWKSSLPRLAALASWDREAAANSTSAACSWHGVSCDVLGRVVSVDVSGAGLAGTLDALDLSHRCPASAASTSASTR